MTGDIVKRLRDVQTRERILGFGGSETLLLFSTEAADLIEAQKAEIERLREALRVVFHSVDNHAVAEMVRKVLEESK